MVFVYRANLYSFFYQQRSDSENMKIMLEPARKIKENNQ
jgi:hypothetical protein